MSSIDNTKFPLFDINIKNDNNNYIAIISIYTNKDNLDPIFIVKKVSHDITILLLQINLFICNFNNSKIKNISKNNKYLIIDKKDTIIGKIVDINNENIIINTHNKKMQDFEVSYKIEELIDENDLIIQPYNSDLLIWYVGEMYLFNFDIFKYLELDKNQINLLNNIYYSIYTLLINGKDSLNEEQINFLISVCNKDINPIKEYPIIIVDWKNNIKLILNDENTLIEKIENLLIN